MTGFAEAMKYGSMKPRVRYQYFIRSLDLPNESYIVGGEKTSVPDLILPEGERIIQVSKIDMSYNAGGYYCVGLVEREVHD